jgi:hypothetical protein
MIASVQNYYPASFFDDFQLTLEWLRARQQAQDTNWEANVLPTGFPLTSEPGSIYAPSSPSLLEAGIVDLLFAEPLSSNWFGIATFENILMIPPAGQALDNQGGPDGFPINYSPVTFGQGNMFTPVFPLTAAQILAAYTANVQKYDPYGAGVQMCTPSGLQYLHPQPGMDIYGYVLNMQPGVTYRVDLFVATDVFYYQGSAIYQGTFETGGACQGVQPQPSCFQSYLTPGGYWGAQITNPGLVIAVLYPTSVSQPATGWYGAELPAGWVCHSNTGIGQKLTSHFARMYSKTDVEYLQEDNIPIVIQDFYHARVGASHQYFAGTPSLHIYYNDPVLGEPVLVYTTLAAESTLADLPLSFIVPSSSPLYFPDYSNIEGAALQNRCYIYDAALAIIAFATSGNFHAAAAVIAELNYLIDNPGYLAAVILENAQDGNSASRWTKSNPSDTVTDINDPNHPPYGSEVVDFHAAAANDTFTYAGSALPDRVNQQMSWQHEEAAGVTYVFTIGVTSAAGKVTQIQVNSNAEQAAYLSGTTIIICKSPGQALYETVLVDCAGLIASLAGDTLTSINSFQVQLTAAGMMYFTNFSTGNSEPPNSLAFSYDTYYGLVDQAYIRAGAMGWVCYAYCIYMSLTQDWTPAPYLYRMLTFIMTLQSTAADLTNGLFYLGWGEYANPGYQFVPGMQWRASTEHNIDLYFAFMRASALLPTAAIQLQKTGGITTAEAEQFDAMAQTCSAAAATIATQLVANIYIPASGGLPGHFGQGAGGAGTPPVGLDTSEALDCQYLGAMFANAIGRNDIALQCLSFAQQQFYLTNQTIVHSSNPNSYNEAYQQLTPFNGYRVYQDSTGGYSGSPALVWEEGSWGMIAAILRLYGTPGLQTALGVSPDTLLSTLITSRRTVWLTPQQSTPGAAGDIGSTLQVNVGDTPLPWEFQVWPCFSGTVWGWLVANALGSLCTTGNQSLILPSMKIPTGMGQNVTEEEGSSSVGGMTVECNDPTGILKQLAAENALVGQIVQFQQGFAGLQLGDFVTLHTAQITKVGYTSAGLITITLADVQRFVQGKQIFKVGGPFPWAPGEESEQPIGDAIASNAFPVSDKNPRWVQGNPIRVALAVLQNELGIGQDPGLLGSTYILEQLADVYSSEQAYAPQPPPPGWVLYQAVSNGANAYFFNDSTLINPNQFIDVDQWLSLADTTYSGDRVEFKITRSAEGKGWVEDQIFKPLGIYVVVGSDGKMRLKTMRPQASQSVVYQFNQGNILGIPQVERQEVINVVTVKTDVDNDGDAVSGVTTAARAYMNQTTLEQPTSILMYRQEYAHQIESTGLRVNYGAMLRAFLIADNIFRRHAFAPPAYRFEAFLASAAVEIGDLVSLSHPKALDLQGGSLNLVNVTCEVIDKKPNWSVGKIEYLVFDRRYLNVGTPYQIAAAASNPPNYDSATAAQRAQYMYISSAAEGGVNDDGTPGNTIF